MLGRCSYQCAKPEVPYSSYSVINSSCTMTEYTLPFKKWRNWGIVRKCKTEILKDKLQIHSLKSISLVSKRFTLPALFPTIHISLLVWFYPMCAALLGRYLTALASITSWELQHNLGLTLTASCNDLSRPPALFYAETLMCCLGTEALWKYKGRLHHVTKGSTIWMALQS